MKLFISYKTILASLLLMCYSCDEIVMEEDLSDQSVTLVAPANNTQFSSTGISFTWNPTEGATGYRLQIAKPDFENPAQIILDTIVNATNYSTQLNIGTYEWRVQGVNSAYVTPFANAHFTIASNENFQDNAVTLQSPANNLVTNIAQQNLTWQPIIGATAYKVQVYSGDNVINDQTITATNLSVTFPQGNYQWRVRAENGTQQTLYYSRSLLVDTTAPNTPVLSVPQNNATASGTDLNFQWLRASISGSTEKDSIYIYTNNALTILHSKNEASNRTYTATLNAGTYYWVVKSFDQAGNTSARSNIFSFIAE